MKPQKLLAPLLAIVLPTMMLSLCAAQSPAPTPGSVKYEPTGQSSQSGAAHPQNHEQAIADVAHQKANEIRQRYEQRNKPIVVAPVTMTTKKKHC
jgi:hypothetical protein